MFLVIGNGKTGSEVVKIIPKDQLLAVCDTKNPPTLELMKKASAIIVFVPADAYKKLEPLLLESKTPVVLGTTGIEIKPTLPVKAPWIVSPNFSLGMNLLFGVAQAFPIDLVGDVHISEEHHINKKDSPSGTSLYLKKMFPEFETKIESKRTADAKGQHTVTFDLGGELISITHTTLDRRVYASGALMAAESITDLPVGVYYFDEILSGSAEGEAA